MAIVFGLLMLAGVAVFVAWPFFSRRYGGVAAEEVVLDDDARWERQKVDAYGAIKDVEFDYQMGKLTDADFNALRERYAARALEAIAAIENAKRKGGADATRPIRMQYCSACGRRLPARANFCPACGQSFRAVRSAAS